MFLKSDFLRKINQHQSKIENEADSEILLQKFSSSNVPFDFWYVIYKCFLKWLWVWEGDIILILSFYVISWLRSLSLIISVQILFFIPPSNPFGHEFLIRPSAQKLPTPQ